MLGCCHGNNSSCIYCKSCDGQGFPTKTDGRDMHRVKQTNVGEFSIRTNRQHASVWLSQTTGISDVRNIWQNTDFSCWFTHVATTKTATTDMKQYRPCTQSIIFEVWRTGEQSERYQRTNTKMWKLLKKQPQVAQERTQAHQNTRQLQIKHHESHFNLTMFSKSFYICHKKMYTSCSETAEKTQNSTLKSDEWKVSIVLGPWLKK